MRKYVHGRHCFMCMPRFRNWVIAKVSLQAWRKRIKLYIEIGWEC